MSHPSKPFAGQTNWDVALNNALDIAYDHSSSGYNVKSSPYYAVGDGVTDDTTAIQNAINAANTAGGGVVYLPRGTYKITGLTGKAKVSIIGEGDAASVLSTSGSGITFLSSSEIVANILYSNFGITGSGTGTYTGIDIGTTTGSGANPTDYVRLEKLSINTFGGIGITLRGPIVSSISDCIVTNTQGGFYLDGTLSWCTSVTLTDCYANATGAFGYKIFKATYVSGQGLATDSCTNGYYLSDVSAAAFVACGVEVSSSQGWYITGSSTYGTSAINLVGCYAAECLGVGYDWQGYSAGSMVGSRSFSSAGSPPASLNLASTASVTGLANIFNATITGTGKKVFIDAADASGTPIGMSSSPASPYLLPWSDSIKAINRGNAANIPLVVQGMAGQSGPLIRAITSALANVVAIYSNGTIAFGSAEDVTLFKNNGGLATNGPIKIFTASSMSNLNSTYPASSYYGYLAGVESANGMKLVISNGSSWVAASPATGWTAPA